MNVGVGLTVVLVSLLYICVFLRSSSRQSNECWGGFDDNTSYMGQYGCVPLFVCVCVCVLLSAICETLWS